MKAIPLTCLSEHLKSQERVNVVKNSIKKILGVDAGHSSCLEIQSSVLGFKDFNTVKAMKFISVRRNVSGSSSNPLWIKFDIGYFKNYIEAITEIRNFIDSCNEFAEWFIFEDEDNTEQAYRSFPESENGYTYQINVTGKTIDDIEFSLNEVIKRLDNNMGFDSNSDGDSFNFIRCGDEFNPVKNNNFTNPENYIIFDSKGVVKESLSYDYMEDEHLSISEFEEFCVFARSVDSSELEDEYDDIVYYLFDDRRKCVAQGDYSDIIDYINELNNCDFVLYEEIQIRHS